MSHWQRCVEETRCYVESDVNKIRVVDCVLSKRDIAPSIEGAESCRRKVGQCS